MKRFVFLFLSILAAGNALAMQKNDNEIPQITYRPLSEGRDPLVQEMENFIIQARVDKKIIGKICYCTIPSARKGIIGNFIIKDGYRKKGIGFNLFKQAMEHIRTTCNKVEWTAMEDANNLPIVPLDTIGTIYQKMVAKLGSDYSLIKMQEKKCPTPSISMILKIKPSEEIQFPKSNIADTLQISIKLNDKELGYILYSLAPFSATQWKIQQIHINEDDQGKSYASKLFEECFKDIIARNGTKVSWESSPFDERSSDELVALYEHIIDTKIRPIKNGEFIKIPDAHGITNMYYIFAK